MMNFDAELNKRAAEAEEIIHRYLPKEEGMQKTIFSAMNYSVNAGGKRIRPILMMETFRTLGGTDMELVEPFMAAIEMIHTYSLIHDDLPALDNDDYRRGKLTSHKVFGEAMAILAGDALQSYAYELAAKKLSSVTNRGDAENIRRVVRAMRILTEKPGVCGMIAGQTVDVEMTGKPVDDKVLQFIFELKTGAMIEASMMIGACLAGADRDQIHNVEHIAYCIGMAFQIRDDILDVISSLDQLGKDTQSDAKNEKTTWVTLYGMDQAMEDVEKYSEFAFYGLKKLGVENVEETFLYELVKWMIARDH